MNVNLKEKIADIYARKGTREAPARCAYRFYSIAFNPEFLMAPLRNLSEE